MRVFTYYKRLLRNISVCAVALVFCNVVNATELTSMTAITITLDEAIEIAKSNQSGKVVKAEQFIKDDRLFYRIRLVNNGHVRDVFVDAANGALILQ